MTAENNFRKEKTSKRKRKKIINYAKKRTCTATYVMEHI